MKSIASAGTKSVISMVSLAGTRAFSKSSSVITTYWPFSYSYPFTISDQGTSTPSSAQNLL